MDSAKISPSFSLPYFFSDDMDQGYAYLLAMLCDEHIVAEMVSYVHRLTREGHLTFVINDSPIQRILSRHHNNFTGFTRLPASRVAIEMKQDYRGPPQATLIYSQLPCLIIEYFHHPPLLGTYNKYFAFDQLYIIGDPFRFESWEVSANFHKYAHVWGPRNFAKIRASMENKPTVSQQIIQVLNNWPINLTNFVLKQMKCAPLPDDTPVSPLFTMPVIPIAPSSNITIPAEGLVPLPLKEVYQQQMKAQKLRQRQQTTTVRHRAKRQPKKSTIGIATTMETTEPPEPMTKQTRDNSEPGCSLHCSVNDIPLPRPIIQGLSNPIIVSAVSPEKASQT